MTNILTVSQSTNPLLANTYQVTYSDGIVCSVPISPLNKDYQAVLAWVSGGGVINMSS